jgi:hypothetical protein
MIAMWMMQVAIDQVVKVIAMRNPLVCTAWAVYMRPVMSITLGTRRTPLGIRRVHFKHVFVNVVVVCVL